MPFHRNFEDSGENGYFLRRVFGNFSAVSCGPGSKAGQCAQKQPMIDRSAGKTRLTGSSSAATAAPGQMLRAARAGGPEALGRLLEYYRPYLRLLAKLQVATRLKKELDASDIVQETFLDAARDFRQFRGNSEPEFLAWLKRLLAANVADTHRRFLGTQKRNVLQESQVLKMLNQSSALIDQRIMDRAGSPSSVAARSEQAVRLAAALERLRPAYHDVILLHHFQGLEFQQVAEQLGRSVHSVKNLWLRALVALRGQMGEPS
jgi:RNA polymerase sigma-70 factor (ECF subfamily)